jgi:Spy/CpxP family protein refolding chaperone
MLAVVVIVALAAAPAWAQGRRGGGGGGMGGQGRGGATGGGRSGAAAVSPPLDEDTLLLLLSTFLKLDEAQNQRAKTLMDGAVVTAVPLVEKIAENKNALFDAATGGKSASDIKSLAAEGGSLMSEMFALQTQTVAGIAALLTPEQKPKLDSTVYGEVVRCLTNARPPSPPPQSLLPATK